MNIETKFRQILQNTRSREEAYTKIAVIGQPGAGKSSLINNLLGEKVATTGPATDVTQKVTKYDCSFVKIYDTPGYGTEKFSYTQWRKICCPEQFDVLIYVFSGKFIDADDSLFDELRRLGKPLFLVRNHSEDLVMESDKTIVIQDMQKRYQNFEKIYFVNCGRIKEGIGVLRNDVLSPDFRDLWKKRVCRAFTKERDSYLREARKKAMGHVDSYKKLAGLNGMNPIPGLDVAGDLGLYFSMFGDIRVDFGIDQQDFSAYMAIPVAKKLLALATKEGIVILLKNCGTKYAAKTLLKWIPGIGYVLGGFMGWQLCEWAGKDYYEQCRVFAKDVLDNLVEEEVNNLLSDF